MVEKNKFGRNSNPEANCVFHLGGLHHIPSGQVMPQSARVDYGIIRPVEWLISPGGLVINLLGGIIRPGRIINEPG